MSTAKVYQAIAAVTAAMGHEGISKARKNQQQGYNFRGIDDVYNALSSMLAEHKLCILPNVLEREVVERQSGQNKALFYVTVKVRFDFVSAEDGSKHEVITYGEAMDSGDKATNKAMSAAYKYAAMQAFCIPTEGDNDADATTHTVEPRQEPDGRSQQIEADPEPDAAVIAQMNAAKDVPTLTKVMNSLSQGDRRLYTGHFQTRMQELKKAA